MFDLFESQKVVTGGTGIGLAFCKETNMIPLEWNHPPKMKTVLNSSKMPLGQSVVLDHFSSGLSL